MPSFRTLRTKFIAENPQILAEDVDFVLAERQNLTPSQYRLQLDQDLPKEQLTQIKKI